ncbi:MAG: tail fiber protein [Acidimicrobiales bacterium]
MSEPFVGEIRLFGFNFAPRGWATCDGQLLSIAQNTALFSLLGTMYGGDGIQTFALPDLRGRVAIHRGQGPGLSPYDQGQTSGAEAVTLTQNQMPQHSHAANVSQAAAATARPAGNVPSAGGAYVATPDGSTFNAAHIQSTGGGQPFSVVQPSLVLNHCIALEGIYPSRN